MILNSIKVVDGFFSVGFHFFVQNKLLFAGLRKYLGAQFIKLKAKHKTNPHLTLLLFSPLLCGNLFTYNYIMLNNYICCLSVYTIKQNMNEIMYQFGAFLCWDLDFLLSVFQTKYNYCINC